MRSSIHGLFQRIYNMFNIKKMSSEELKNEIKKGNKSTVQSLFCFIELRMRLHEAECHGKGNSEVLSSHVSEAAEVAGKGLVHLFDRHYR